MQALPKDQGPILVARHGKANDQNGMSDQLVELVPTAPLNLRPAEDDGFGWEAWSM